MKKRFEKLLEKAAQTEDFQAAYTLGGFDLAVNILDLKEDLEEIVGAGLGKRPATFLRTSTWKPWSMPWKARPRTSSGSPTGLSMTGSVF